MPARAIKKIVIYNTSWGYGGHEVMTAALANILAEKYDVYFLYISPGFEKHLTPEVNRRKINLKACRPILGWRSRADFLNIQKELKIISPDLAIIAQGNIELGFTGALAAKSLRIKTLSYIPLCFSFRRMGAKMGLFRDILHNYHYQVFDGYITISREQAGLLKKRCRHKPQFVLENVLELSAQKIKKYHPGEVLRIGVIGRINFGQKGQDLAVAIAKKLFKQNCKFKMYIIGSGEDEARLIKIIRQAKLQEQVILKGWQDDKKQIYADLDLVLSTSRFEGVPLTLLEAIWFGRPVLAYLNKATKIYQEYLSDKYLFKNVREAAAKILKYTESPKAKKALGQIDHKLRAKIFQRHNPVVFRKKLLEIVRKVIEL